MKRLCAGAIAALALLAGCLPQPAERPRTDVFVELERAGPGESLAVTFFEDGLVRVRDGRGERWRSVPLDELRQLGTDVAASGFFDGGFARLPHACPDCPTTFLANATTYRIHARTAGREREASFATALGVQLQNGSIALEFDDRRIAALVSRIDDALARSAHFEQPLS
jgi:hypothetical protein